MRLCVVGDGHAGALFEGVGRLYGFPSASMALVGAEGLQSLHADLEIIDADVAVLVFGELDCRCGVAGSGRWPRDVVEELAERFCIAADASCCRTQVVLCSVPPPVSRDDCRDASVRFHGTDEQRAEYTRMLNEALSRRARDRAWVFLDIGAVYADEEGMLPESLSDGSVHVGKPQAARELLVRTLQALRRADAIRG